MQEFYIIILLILQCTKYLLDSISAITSPPAFRNPAYGYLPVESNSIPFATPFVHATQYKHEIPCILRSTKPNLSPTLSDIKPWYEIAQVQNLAYAQATPKSCPFTRPSPQEHTYDTVQFEAV